MTLGRDARVRLLLLAAAALALLFGAWSLSRSRPPAKSGPEALAPALARVVAREQRFVSALDALAASLAKDADASPALAGDNEARARLFARFASAQAAEQLRPSISLVDGNGTALAWAGSAPEAASLRGRLRRAGVFIREGAIATSLVVTAPAAEDGTILVEAPVRVRRNIANEYLRDFDAWIGDDLGAEIAYEGADAGLARGPVPRLPAIPKDLPRLEHELTGPNGQRLATVRVTPATDRLSPRRVPAAVLGAAATLAVLALLLIATVPLRRRGAVWIWAGIVLAARAACEALLQPGPRGLRSVLSSDLYVTGLRGAERWLESPLDLLLAAILGSLLAFGLARLIVARADSRSFSLPRFVVAAGAVAAAAAPLFACVADVVANTNADLTAFALDGEALSVAAGVRAIQLALLLIVAAGLLLAAAVLRQGAWPRSLGGRAAAALAWCAVGAGAALWWWHRFPTPRAALGCFCLGALLLAVSCGRILVRPEEHRDTHRVAALFALVLAAVLAVQPAVVGSGAQHTRDLIQSAYAPFVLEQPLLRRSVLEDAYRTVDRLDVLDPAAAAGPAPALEQMAFAVWSRTELSTFGLSSAVEIHDENGRVVSRFALNLPALTERPVPRPDSAAWQVRREVLPLGSVQQPVLHASRALLVPGLGPGAIDLYVSEDYWNLPFLTPRDPYSLLYRPASLPSQRRGPPVDLFVFDARGQPAFYSTERPPMGLRTLEPKSRAATSGFWTSLDLDGQPFDGFVFGDGTLTNVLGYPRRAPLQRVADLLDAAASALCVTALAIALLLAVRTLLRRRSFSLATLVERIRGRFAWRLLVAFVLLAVVPVGVLQVVATRVVRARLERATENQALQRAYVSQKAVEDYAVLQGEDGAPSGVSDDALIYVASLLRSDLALFQGGRLRAASKRELYTSGLLSPQVDAQAFRQVVLEGQPYAFSDEGIGGFTYRVVSLPAALGPFETGVLSLPMTFQGGAATVGSDLSRSIRLASLLFLAAGAALAYFMAWRISGPVSALTGAARRIAAGDLDTRVNAGTSDEIATLMDAFNRMAADLLRQRADLEKSNRRAAWADMARQVAHEVKNPLTPIRLSAEHLRRVYRERPADFPEVLEACVSTILGQVDRLRGIATEFSAFARPASRDRELVDPGELVADVLEPYRMAAPPGVALDLEIAAAVPPVLVERKLVERAFVNLVENALQAVMGGGGIRVSVFPGDDGRGGMAVNFDVVDSGPGIDESLRARLFEPFFSTKTGGTGLGLVLSRKIAEDHGGSVLLASAPGEPTRIRLWLPAAAAPMAPSGA